MIKYFEFKIMTFYLTKVPLMISASRLQMNEAGGGRPKRERVRLANFLPLKLKEGGRLNRRLMVFSRLSRYLSFIY